MPIYWPIVPVNLPVLAYRRPAALTQGRPSPEVKVDDELVVRSESYEFDPVTSTYTFVKGVVATYGMTTIRSDRLTVSMQTKVARADGSVELDDPEVSLSASFLEFSWREGARSGSAQDIRARIGNVNVSAKSALIKDGLYELIDVAGSSCSQRIPLYQIRTPRLVINPSRKGKATKPRIYVLGHKLLTLPSRQFSLDRRTEGLQVPSLSYRRDGSLGLSWQSGFLLNEQTNLRLSSTTFANTRPSMGAVLTRTYLPAEKINDIITPNSELNERFQNGYLENIQIGIPEDERGIARNNRKSISLASTANQGVVGKPLALTFSKPVEAVGEIGGEAFGTGGYTGQLRLQSIRRAGEANYIRSVLIGSLLAPKYEILPKLEVIARLDANLFTGSKNYGWGRGNYGLSYAPAKPIRLSIGYVASDDFGVPNYPELDALTFTNGYVMRGDIDLGPTQIRYMTKYDRRLGFFDREYYISQVVGCLEAFVLYRKVPGDYNLGIRFRLDGFYNLLKKKDFKRRK